MHTFLQGNPTVTSLVASVLMSAVLLTSYFLFEPLITHGQEVDEFTVTQEINSELAFISAATDVTMTPALQGIAGGTAFGTSTVGVNTNNPTGYSMTIEFATATAMQGENLNSDIDNYDPVGAVPDYNFTIPANDAVFGYTVNSVTTPLDIHDDFQDNGSNACGGGATGVASGKCWNGVTDATSAVTIINRLTATPGSGATSTIVFQVGIAANPSPAIESGFYTATATLTAVTN